MLRAQEAEILGVVGRYALEKCKTWTDKLVQMNRTHGDRLKYLFFRNTLHFVGCALLLVCGGNAFAGEVKNLALGAHYTFKPAARYDLTRDPGDATQLTDGRYVGGHFWTSRDRDAVGWVESGPIYIEIDLSAVRSINGVCFNTARGNHAGVSFPDRVDVLVSSDMKQYVALGDAYQGKPHEDGSYLVQKFCAANLAAVGRYVLLVVQPRGGYAFLDEIEVLGSDNVTSNGRSTAALIKRGEIGDALRAVHGLAHREEALVRLAARMLANPDCAKPEMQSRIKSFASRLVQEPVGDLDALEKLQDELLALHRMALSSNFKEPLIVWRKSPWAVFSQIDSPTPDSLIKDGLDFDLMRRGSASNAFVLTNNSDRPQRFKVDVTLEGRAEVAPQLEVREVVPVVASNHETIGDALRPLENGEVSIKPGESRQIWLTVLAGTSAMGEYAGKVSVASLQNNLPATNVSLHVKIWPAVFPEQQHVFVNAWSYLNWRAIKKTPELAVRDLVAHHVNVFELDSSQIPWPNFRAGGTGDADFTKADEVLNLHRGAKKRLFFLEFNTEPFRTFGGKYVFMSATWKLVFKKWVRDWVAHLKAQGLDYQDFAFYPLDEPENSELVGYLLETASLIKEVDPNIRVFTTIGKPVGGVGLYRLSRVVDIFQLNMRSFSNAQKIVLTGLNKEVWSYSAFGGGKLAEPMGYYRMQAWKAFSNGLTGIGFWAYADTGSSGTAWDDFDGTRPDFSVIYEGKSGLVSSKRWEAWREGVEDYELLMLARQKLKPGKETAEFDTKVSGIINNASDYRQFEVVRRYLLTAASR